MTTTIELNKIAKAVIDEIWDGPTEQFVPIYRSDIKNEKEADTAIGLPLMYVWNEKVINGQLIGFSFSVNGKIIGSALERRLPRSSPDFVRVRDGIMDSIRDAQMPVVTKSCQRLGLPPSAIYTKPVS